MSELYVLRHGSAEPRKKGLADGDRQLTDQGREKLGLVLARARKLKVAPSVILTSPLARALQTAELVAKTLSPKAKIVQTEALLPGSAPDAVWNEIRKRAAKGPVLIAGHEPLLGETISFLVGADHGIIDLKKGALACLDVDPKKKRPSVLLEWLITPRVCQDGGEKDQT
jgi:phosphohistidine phosphatase